jgi:hypothetical protein
MKKLLLILLLVFSQTVYADWKYVISSKDKISDTYIDSDSIKRDGKYVKVWIKTEYKEPQKDKWYDFFNTYRSVRSYEEWNCVDRSFTTISYDVFSKNSLQGKIVDSSSILLPVPTNIAPDSTEEILYKIICKKK